MLTEIENYITPMSKLLYIVYNKDHDNIRRLKELSGYTTQTVYNNIRVMKELGLADIIVVNKVRRKVVLTEKGKKIARLVGYLIENLNSELK
jgi:hypothetical protein